MNKIKRLLLKSKLFFKYYPIGKQVKIMIYKKYKIGIKLFMK